MSLGAYGNVASADAQGSDRPLRVVYDGRKVFSVVKRLFFPV